MGSIQRFAGRGAALALLALVAAGCGGKGGASVAYDDPHPLPQDTMHVATPQAGTYGGRFVIAETSSPKTFNAMMANETSSTDVTDRMFISLTDLDYETQQDYGVLAKSWDMSDDGLICIPRCRT
jgi:ABC-type oligopeptide transport system substrate-binding subunit